MIAPVPERHQIFVNRQIALAKKKARVMTLPALPPVLEQSAGLDDSDWDHNPSRRESEPEQAPPPDSPDSPDEIPDDQLHATTLQQAVISTEPIVTLEQWYDFNSTEGSPLNDESRRRLNDVSILYQETGTQPLSWSYSLTALLARKGSDGSPAKHRLINLIDSFAKIFWTLLMSFPGACNERHLPEMTAFRKKS